MEKIEVPVHNHPLIPFARFDTIQCGGWWYGPDYDYIYRGYRCNELGCNTVFHKECAESLPEINHSSHPDHPLKLVQYNFPSRGCSLCSDFSQVGYLCSICEFRLDLHCAKNPPSLFLENPNVHEHPLQLFKKTTFDFLFEYSILCKTCNSQLYPEVIKYKCSQCNLFFHVDCVKFFPEAYHPSHPQHLLKYLRSSEAPDYADKKCLLCGKKFLARFHHCGICNYSICRVCMRNPPPICVVSQTTHQHPLHLVPRRIDFTCNACGTQGDNLSPYFCLQCNFMIHRNCIDLPRVININRHDHRIFYTSRVGYGKSTCGVCRKNVDGFHGAYSCSVCSCYVVHSQCATRKDVWDMIEREGTTEEPEEAPFEIVDDNIIKHFGHDHNLQINRSNQTLNESTLCEACLFQICSESFYSCKQCDFFIHEKCANLPRKKRHVGHNIPFMLYTGSHPKSFYCSICNQEFTGFRYEAAFGGHFLKTLDVRCGSISEPFVHKSHPHPLYYTTNYTKCCSRCGISADLICDECDYCLDFKCAILPQKVTRHRYDDHPLFLSYGETNMDFKYWCEACETKLNPKEWFYTCNDCGITLHITCVVGGFSYIKPGSCLKESRNEEVVSNTRIYRPICCVCSSRCKLSSILKVYKDEVDVYFCSSICYRKHKYK